MFLYMLTWVGLDKLYFVVLYCLPLFITFFSFAEIFLFLYFRGVQGMFIDM